MTRGRGIKRSREGRGHMSNKGGGGNQQLPNTSQEDVSEPSTPMSQQIGSNNGIVSSNESNSQQIVHTSQDGSARKTTPAPQSIGSHQEIPTSIDVGRQQAPSSQNVGAEKATPGQTRSFGSSNPQERRATLGGIKSLKVNGDTLCPHEAVRDVSLAFKKSFTGPWHCWSKVPEYVRDKWFNDFEKSYSFPDEDKVFVRKTFDRVGSERLSDSLGKAKREFSRTKKIPKWIAEVHWDGLMRYWNSDDFKKISAINKKNRMSSNNEEGPSLHTGGSVAFAKYRRRHKELTGEDLRSDELYLKTHKTKNEKKWICGKSERIWNSVTKNIKEKVGETSTLRNEDGLEVDDGDLERNTTTDGEGEGEETSEDNDCEFVENYTGGATTENLDRSSWTNKKRKNIWSWPQKFFAGRFIEC
ncbi:uncharacterized protein LOC132617871 [Lycium barbarum]|uniref:uncharacterized protein LOC132617871 n=1 Tax=Lycium barbarum TaxID=112863 RepID=UPI00293E5663|nr:uncharacterized protein LOC132617871 [Lycium barbarum]XP_060188923.1 uncharacterized protein LOC132617871 [Lycium barbarum]